VRGSGRQRGQSHGGSSVRRGETLMLEAFHALRWRSIWGYFRQESFAFWMVCGYLFFEYVRPQSIFPALDFLPWPRLFLLGALAGWMADRKSRWVSAPAHKWMILFLLVIIASIYAAQYPDISKAHFSDFLSWFIVYFALVLNVNNPRRLYILLLIFLAASFKLSFSLALRWAMRGFSFTSWGLQGPPGYFTNSGELSIQMLVFAPIAYRMYQVMKPHLTRWKQVLMVLMPTTAAMTIIGASSRGAQLGLVYVVYALFLKGRISIRSIAVTAVLAGAVYYAIPDAQMERFAQTGKDKTSEQRLRYWTRGVDMLNEFPVLGVGFFNFIPYFESRYPDDMLYESAQLPHNIFVQVATDAGYSGLFMYSMIIVQIFAANRRTTKLAPALDDEQQFYKSLVSGLNVGTVAFLIAGQFVSVAYYPFIWMNLALSVATEQICRNQVRQKEGGVAPTRRRIG
jgi:O-antigen ligase